MRGGLPLVRNRDAYARVEESHLAETAAHRIKAEVDLVEDRVIRKEGNDRSGVALVDIPFNMNLVDRFAADEFLHVGVPVAVNLRAKGFTQRVDAADANAVETAGDLVAPAAELASRVEHGQRDGERVLARFFVQADRNAAPVVHNGYGVIRADKDFHVRAVAGQRFVNGVIDHLGDEVMQSARIR